MNNFDRVHLSPEAITKIEHRAECIPYYDATFDHEANGWSLAGAHLPLFTAPMACIVDDKNYLEFDKNGIIPIIPRTVPYEKRLELSKQMVWIAVGLDEFENFINTTDSLEEETFICIDIANGHMKKLLDLCQFAKKKFNNLVLMAGNVAHPQSYYDYAKAGIDYIRINIGSGSGCATNDLTGIGYPPIQLLQDIKYRKENVARDSSSLVPKYRSVPRVVFDGGCTSIRDIIIALALGADYVMCGKIFAQAKEACGEIVEKGVHVTKQTLVRKRWKSCRLIETPGYEFKPGRMYYGMSTERAQREMGHTKIKHSEGKEYWVEILYSLKDWVDQFVAAISSTMSYCDTRLLYDFIGKPEYRFDN